MSAGRGRVVSAGRRLRDSAWSAGQCALAAGAAWTLATRLLGHPRPYFACVAAVVCLGVRANQRLRRIGELGVGVTVGVAVGDALASEIGTGSWQISLIVGIALLLALTLDGGPLLVNQAGLQAVFVVALPRTPGSGLARWEDAFLGAATALAVAALLPADPWSAARRSAERSFRELAAVARGCAGALRHDDPAEAMAALDGARGTQGGLDAWKEALAAGREISRLSPLRWDRHGHHASLSRLQVGVDRATRNLRVLVRRVVFALETGEELYPGLADELDRFAGAVAAVSMADGAGPPAELLSFAGELDPELLGAAGLSGSVVLAQLRAAVVDLLVGVGIDMVRARTALPPLH